MDCPQLSNDAFLSESGHDLICTMSDQLSHIDAKTKNVTVSPSATCQMFNIQHVAFQVSGPVSVPEKTMSTQSASYHIGFD